MRILNIHGKVPSNQRSLNAKGICVPPDLRKVVSPSSSHKSSAWRMALPMNKSKASSALGVEVHELVKKTDQIRSRDC